MCGIVGIVGEQSWDWVEAMNGAQFHRGPDGQGAFQDKENLVSLAMRRLAILDIEGGAQPKVSSDGRFAIVYNGEIFNAPELRQELKSQGVTFTSDHSDTEVLFRLLQLEGVRCLSKLNGMFSFALWDSKEREVILARDRFGIKPLHYFKSSNRLVFSSEIKSILSLPFVDSSLDLNSVSDYFSLLYVPGESTIYKKIKRVPPGCYLKFSLDRFDLVIKKYWSMSFQPTEGLTRVDWCEAVRNGLNGAVKRWAWSDVPVALSLSGGLDSSAIAGLMASQGLKPKSFSLGFSGDEDKDWNELPLAKQVAEKWGLDHEEIFLDPGSLLDELPLMVSALDEPYGGGLPSWFVFQAISKQYKVAITGTGGDELFGNYGKWRQLEAKWLGRFGKRNAQSIGIQSFSRKMFDKYYYAPDSQKRLLFSDESFSARETSKFLKDKFDEAVGRGAGTVRDAHAIMDIETQLADEFLLMTDRFSMAHSLEARTPFLDNEFVEVVSSIPSEVRTSPHDLKGLLRHAVAPVLPTELLNAPKRGFVIPLGKWLRNELAEMVGEYLDKEKLKRQGIFDSEFVGARVLEHQCGKMDHTHLLWPLLMFQIWQLR
ncbi:MAG: asparagine synthase (glutamine-hydrolyzing) [Pseudomonadota bacterium]|nr:asparagine synthase (glutamine-hydrolyzing) [Pseudomonadota bacterium]